MGLVASGSVSRSFVTRLSALHARLGPVKGVSFPSARRLVVSLRAGVAVPHYSALEFCAAIWIVAPEASLDHISRDLAAQTPMHRTAIIICGSSRESTSFDYLRAKGARVATLNSVDDVWQASFIAEGHRDALTQIRDILSKDKRRCIELGSGSKAKYLAGVHMLTDLLRPWTTAAVECMHAAGIARPDAATLAETLAGRSLRAYSKAGTKAWSPAAHEELEAAKSRAEHLRSQCPREARLYAEGIRLALEYFERGSRARERRIQECHRR